MPPTHRVDSGGLSLSVREHTSAGPGRPTLVLVHGYPDQQEVWLPLVAALVHDDFHVVSYDVRGAGDSGVPPDRDGYRIERLVDDLVAVLDAVLPPAGRAHLVGHDWGSVQLWDALTAERADPRLTGRLASFVSVSGPSLDHTAYVIGHPRGRRLRVLRQVARSWYVAGFGVPVLPELVWRRAHGPLGRAVAVREGLGPRHWGPELEHNAVRGLELYRANVARPSGHRRSRRHGPLRTDVPVLVVHPTHDAFLTDVLLEELDRTCRDLRVERLDAGHWVICTHPELVAGLVRDHVDAHR